MQLTRARLRRFLRAGVGAMGLFFSRETRAQVAELDTSHTLYHESPFRSKMTVYSPATSLRVSPSEWLDVRAGWEADVVSGASVAVKAGPSYQATHPGADVVTAASVHDFRNVASGGFTLKKDAVQLASGYSYSVENDYKSHNVNIGAKTELFEHNTQLEINYARNFDKVCDRVQAANDAPARFRALEDSDGCFASSVTRSRHSIGVDSFQGSWSQAWTPVFTTQLVYTAQITNGFQSNPYRSVILAEGLKAQEHEPDNRARQSVALRGNYFIRPWRAALRMGIRGYYDTWGIKSGTADLEFEKYFGEAFRLQGRGRIYRQNGAVFWSDDYTGGDRPLGPRGQYWTGDRELSPMTSALVGIKAAYAVSPAKGRILGLITNLKFSASADMIQFNYDEYTLGGATISSARAFIFGLSLSAIF